jgi:outer membrane protein TolC
MARCDRRWLGLAAIVLVTGCATTAVNDNFTAAKDVAQQRVAGNLQWLRTAEARREAEASVDTALAQPLTVDDSVRIALAYSPALQATLFDSAARSAAVTQSARLPNPVFAFERILRNESGIRELEITRAIAFSIYDLLLLPSRLRLAEYRQQQLRLQMSGDVVKAALDARTAWVRAVAAQEVLQYAVQVKAAADASAELARRMQSVGNFSKLQRAREQVFAAEAVAQLARAQHQAQATREALVRVLGLNASQANALRLPNRLPNLPAAPRDEAETFSAAVADRLDMRIARANMEYAMQEAGLTNVTSILSGLEIGPVWKSETGLAPQRGYEFEVPIPIFDLGDAARLQAQSTYYAEVERNRKIMVDARSQVIEAYHAYRTAHDLARHYRDDIVPLRKTIAEENVLRYNGMIIGVFELLADTREQIASVMQAIEVQRDFWLADAALQATLIGQPSTFAMETAPSAAAQGASRGH